MIIPPKYCIKIQLNINLRVVHVAVRIITHIVSPSSCVLRFGLSKITSEACNDGYTVMFTNIDKYRYFAHNNKC